MTDKTTKGKFGNTTISTKGRKKMSDEEKKARMEALKNEPKTEKFKRLAKLRVPKTLKSIENLKNLSGYQYESTPDQRNKIVNDLQNAVNKVKSAFESTKTETETKEYEI